MIYIFLLFIRSSFKEKITSISEATSSLFQFDKVREKNYFLFENNGDRSEPKAGDVKMMMLETHHIYPEKPPIERAIFVPPREFLKIGEWQEDNEGVNFDGKEVKCITSNSFHDQITYEYTGCDFWIRNNFTPRSGLMGVILDGILLDSIQTISNRTMKNILSFVSSNVTYGKHNVTIFNNQTGSSVTFCGLYYSDSVYDPQVIPKQSVSLDSIRINESLTDAQNIEPLMESSITQSIEELTHIHALSSTNTTSKVNRTSLLPIENLVPSPSPSDQIIYQEIKESITFENQTGIPPNIEIVAGNEVTLKLQNGEEMAIENIKACEDTVLKVDNLVISNQITLEGQSIVSAIEGSKIDIIHLGTVFNFHSTTDNIFPFIDLGLLGEKFKKTPKSINIIIDSNLTKVINLVRGRTLNCLDWLGAVRLIINENNSDKYFVKCEYEDEKMNSYDFLLNQSTTSQKSRKMTNNYTYESIIQIKPYSTPHPQEGSQSDNRSMLITALSSLGCVIFVILIVIMIYFTCKKRAIQYTYHLGNSFNDFDENSDSNITHH
ncbi:hypothetical protein TRFO_07920 [Tritrichomonas foetus]|uniref:Uncharacterized protein n=1 Tax=Tritrichomonas foetus TaxID=1144522 RepID=A0A1J4JPA8_9EUKA|nr:hypothetical protein TRFO_07920 [Tritrichomonas foetus]|eukprot:OHT00578.1 hypothetical protein TRFO_07920 [Tritrichomonas foetus]